MSTQVEGYIQENTDPIIYGPSACVPKRNISVRMTELLVPQHQIMGLQLLGFNPAGVKILSGLEGTSLHRALHVPAMTEILLKRT